MSNLTYEDKVYLEKYLQMESGWLLNFSNDSLQRFVFKNAHIDIFHNKYDTYGSSKAKRMRAVWDIEPDYVVRKIIKSFIQYYNANRIANPDFFKASTEVQEECIKISDRLLAEGVSRHTELISAITDEPDFMKLAKSIKEHIEKNDPELALDRLHTFYMKYLRELCTKNEILFNSEESLNALYGKYIKFVESKSVLESDMSKAIMKYSINILEKYNDVRNNRSLAHDNKLLNYRESLYIFDILARLKGFIDEIQEDLDLKKRREVEQKSHATDWPDLPF